jgi:adenine C2-methylase RlmN of 23S rRNA A2503 and tRNA A37
MGVCLSVALRACREKIRQVATIQEMAVLQDPRNDLTGTLKADIRVDVDRSMVDRVMIRLTGIPPALR